MNIIQIALMKNGSNIYAGTINQLYNEWDIPRVIKTGNGDLFVITENPPQFYQGRRIYIQIREAEIFERIN